MSFYSSIRGRAILAPLEGIGTPAFVELCASLGSPVVFPGMVNARAVAMGKITVPRIVEGAIFGVQLFGTQPEDFRAAARNLSSIVDVLDLNLGCPARDIVSIGAGCKLMKHPDLVERIVDAMASEVEHVWVKMRLSHTRGVENFMDIARIAIDAGAEVITLHPRYCVHDYSEGAKWDRIKALVSRNPGAKMIIGNGDVFSTGDFHAMMDETGCDAVMIGRAAMRNPGIFSEINLKRKVSLREVMETYLWLARKWNESESVMKIHLTQFVHGLPGARKFRERISRSRGDEIIQIVDEFLEASVGGK